MKTLTHKLKAMCESAQGVILTTEEVEAMRQSAHGVILIDVLTRESFAAEHVPGAWNVPLWHPTFVRRVERALGGKERPVVVYSASGRCDASLKAARLLSQSGFTRVYRYRGGLEAWKAADKPVATGTAPVPAPIRRKVARPLRVPKVA
ncbi:MAG: rhodanese-like domain-containing protein [Planctomycetota bacterium]